MTFMRKIMDMLDMNNWEKDTEVFSEISPKWVSIRDVSEMTKELTSIDLKNITIYFENGIIYKIIPDVYNYYEAQYYNMDGKIFDTYSIESINSIPIPDYLLTKPTGTPVYNVEYILQRRASQERKRGNNDLAYALIKKSTELMKYSRVGYGKKDYLRIVNWLYEDGQIKEAEKLKCTLQEELPLVFSQSLLHKNLFNHSLDTCEDIESDYIFCSSHQGTCPECAKFQCRVFCISGKDKRFPKLPEAVKKYGGFHEGCIHNFYPFFIGITDTIRDCYLNEYDAIDHSNRPFIDDRTKEDKLLYEIRIQNQNRRIELEKCRRGYFEMCNRFPDATPKSFSAFSRMKNLNSKKYQEFKELAMQNNIYV